MLEGLELATDRKALRAQLLRAVAADHGIGAGLTMYQLIAIAVTHGLRTEADRADAISKALEEAEGSREEGSGLVVAVAR